MASEWPTLNVKSFEELVRGQGPRPLDVARAAFECPRPAFLQAVRMLGEHGARLLTLSAMQQGHGELVLTYTFEVGRNLGILLRTPTQDGAMESLFSSFPSADFLEREVNHLFGVKFLGHPNLPCGGRREGEE